MVVARALEGGEPIDLSGSRATLEQLVDARQLQEMMDSFYGLFRIPLRLITETGTSLVRSGQDTLLAEHLAASERGSERLRELYAELQGIDPGSTGEVRVDAFSGASYHVVAVGHEGRRIGRAILGPFVSPGLERAPKSLTELDPELDAGQLCDGLMALPRVGEETIRAISRHLALTFEVLVFVGHQLMLTKRLQLGTVYDCECRLGEAAAAIERQRREMTEMQRRHARALARLSRRVGGPLDAMLALADRLPEAALSDDARDQWSRARGAAVSARTTLSRLESLEGTASARESVSVSGLLAAVERELTPHAAARQLVLRVESDPGLPALRADFGRLREALVHLGENALRATPEGGEVRIRARSLVDPEVGATLFDGEPRGVEFRVEDRGCGLKGDEKARAFEAFQADGAADGRDGLGLTLARAHVQAHGGELRLEDNQPSGVAAVVSLPGRRQGSPARDP